MSPPTKPAPTARQDGDRYFHHDADIGVIGQGASIEEAFVEAARAMFELVSNLSEVRPSQHFDVVFDEPDVELALTVWLNALVAEAQSRHVIFSRFTLRRDGNHWHGTASGERWRPDLERGVEVKGATLTMLSVRRTGETWEARCVVDV